MATCGISWTLRTWPGFGLAVLAMLIAGGYIARLGLADAPMIALAPAATVMGVVLTRYLTVAHDRQRMARSK